MSLVNPLENVDLPDCRDRVKAAHDYLVCRAKVALAAASAVTHVDDWGTFMKRVRVPLPPEGKPVDIPTELTDHRLTEVYNQCATMERLLGALNWLIGEPGFSQCRVRCCHPTTSSNPAEKQDNDLMLVNEQGTLCACFEVSDVASSTSDSNQKETKDLVSLGVLKEAEKREDMMKIVAWPEWQCFLIVSEEFADHLRPAKRYWLDPKKSGPHCCYVEVKAQGSTRIFQVRQGAR
jgi:hypothetical protein